MLFKKLFSLFIFGCVGSSLLCADFSLVAVSLWGGAALRCGALASLVVEHGL